MNYRHVDPPRDLDYGPRGGPPRAFVWHHAEGNNVAAYLSRNPARGVSVNFTVEADGEIISMVPIDHVSGTINPRTIRTTDDGPDSDGAGGRYGATLAKALLGDGWRDPNRWTIGIELAGKAADGPNAKQVASMKLLIADMRDRFPNLKGNLGHRDFQTVKPCPGRKVPWGELSGHGLFGQEAHNVATVGYDKTKPLICTVLQGAHLYDYPGQPLAGRPTTSEKRDEDYLGRTPDSKFHLVSAIVDGVKGTKWVSNGAIAGSIRTRPVATVPDPLAEERGNAEGYNEAIVEEQAWAMTREQRKVPA